MNIKFSGIPDFIFGMMRVLAGWTGLVFAISFFCLAVVHWFYKPVCDIIPQSAIDSPDGQWAAIGRIEACGGATGIVTHYVALKAKSANISVSGSQDILEFHAPNSNFTPHWLDNTHLEVLVPKATEIFALTKSYAGISVTTKTYPANLIQKKRRAFVETIMKKPDPLLIKMLLYFFLFIRPFYGSLSRW